MFRMIPDLIGTITGALPLWALVILGTGLAIVLVPSWFHGVRGKQIKTRLRWLGRSNSDAERDRWEREAFELAAGIPRRLVTLAEEAHKLNQFTLYRRAMVMLEEDGTYELDLIRLRELTAVKRPRYRHPLEATVAIEQLVKEGMRQEALTRVSEAREHFPDDSDLAALQSTLAEDNSPA